METLCILFAVAAIILGIMLRVVSTKANAFMAKHAEVSTERDKYVSVIDGLEAAVNGDYDPSGEIYAALKDESDDAGRISETMSFVYALNAVQSNLRTAAELSPTESVADQVSIVRKNVKILSDLTKKVSSFLTFVPGNLLETIAALEKAGNVSAVKTLINENLATLSRILAPFKQTAATMDALSVSRADVGIVEGDVMDTLLNVASRLPEVKKA